MRKTLSFDKLIYSINGTDHVLRFDNRRDSFDCEGNRVLFGQIAEVLGMGARELRAYVEGLRNMRQLAKTEERDMARVRWFCSKARRRMVPGETEQQKGYIRALKAIDQMISK